MFRKRTTKSLHQTKKLPIRFVVQLYRSISMTHKFRTLVTDRVWSPINLDQTSHRNRWKVELHALSSRWFRWKCLWSPGLVRSTVLSWIVSRLKTIDQREHISYEQRILTYQCEATLLPFFFTLLDQLLKLFEFFFDIVAISVRTISIVVKYHWFFSLLQ